MRQGVPSGRNRRAIVATPMLVMLGACTQILGVADWSDSNAGGAGASSIGGSGETTSSASAPTTSSTSSETATSSSSSSSSEASSGESASSSSGTGGGCSAQCAMMACFGGACDCGGCQPVTVSAATTGSGPFVAASSPHLGVAYDDAGGGHLAVVNELSVPASLAPVWPAGGAPLDIATDGTNAFVIQSTRIDRITWTGTATPLVTGASLDPRRLQIMNLGGPQLCFIDPDGQGSGGGIYCTSPSAGGTPMKIAMIDFPTALAGDGASAFVVTQSNAVFSFDGSTNSLGSFPTTIGDLAVGGTQIYAVATNGTVYTMAKTGSSATPHGTLLAGTENVRLRGNYLYAQSTSAIARVDLATLGTVETLPTGGGTITDFDVDDEGVYFGVAGVGVRMLGIVSQ